MFSLDSLVVVALESAGACVPYLHCSHTDTTLFIEWDTQLARFQKTHSQERLLEGSQALKTTGTTHYHNS
jgi:predicted acylesterase/phospholipase RssA